MREKIGFIKLIRLWGIVLLTALAAIIVGIDLVTTYHDQNIRVDKMRTDYIKEQKLKSRREVERVVDMINYERKQSELLTRKKIQSRVYEAYAIAQNIYVQNKALKDDAEIQKMIVDALRPIRFENENGYYFIIGLDGVSVLFADRSHMEGSNILNTKDTHDSSVLRNLIKIAMESGEGFYEYYWTKPKSTGNDFKKLSFIKRFEPYEWFIGTGLYVEHIESQIKAKWMERINNIRFGKNLVGYLFVDDWNGKSLAHGAQPDLIGTEMWEYEDSRGNKTTQLLIAASKNKDGGYAHFWWRRPDTGEERPKIVYVKSVFEWKLFVGSGVYIDDIEQNITMLQAALTMQTKAKVLIFIIVVGITFALFFILFNWLSNKLKKDLNLFVSFFNQAAISDKKIERKTVQFIELDQMAKYANKMLQDKIIAQQDLLDEREQLFVTIRSIGDGLITIDMSGKVGLINSMAEQLTGWNQESAAHRMLSEVFKIIDGNTREAVDHPVDILLAERPTVENHMVLISKDGTEYNIEACAAQIKDGKNNIRGVVIVFRDISDRKHLETQLQQSQKLESIGTLAGGVAHEINNPIHGIMNYAQLILDKTDDTSPTTEYAREIIHETQRVSSIVRNLLTFAREEKETHSPARLKDIVDNTMSLIQTIIKRDQIILEVDVPEDLPKIKCRCQQIQQVIMNLMTNARDALNKKYPKYDANKQIIISSNLFEKKGKSWIRTTVVDHGEGITPDIGTRLLDPFYTTKSRTGGAGLGLAISYGIVKDHQGELTFESKLGQYTKFHMDLPVDNNWKLAG